ncbi:MAG: hypothetical protein LBV71_06305, partial [Prevotella sp.]|nr:hypothetical protein [Prevotella sp.]
MNQYLELLFSMFYSIILRAITDCLCSFFPNQKKEPKMLLRLASMYDPLTYRTAKRKNSLES